MLFLLNLFATRGCVVTLSGKAQSVCHFDLPEDVMMRSVVLSNYSIFRHYF